MGVFKQLFLEHDGEDMKRLRNNYTEETKHIVLERANGRCECGCNKLPDWRGLSIHHVKPRGMGGTRIEYFPEDLIALRATCHSEKHGIKEG